MKSAINSSQVQAVLENLYADSAKNDPLVHQAARDAGASHQNEAEFFKAVRGAYMAVGRDFGNLLYTLARCSNAKTIIEFGTSFGVSTIYLASAIHDNGAGRVITTEFEPSKAERAKNNLAAAGLEAFVEVRLGDALETLKSGIPQTIDLIMLDGAKSLYLDVLQLLEPNLRRGGIVASDNTNQESLASFVNHVRSPANGYISSGILTGDRTHGHEISIRI
jgi:predicted O-methyltransferase YrrM